MPDFERLKISSDALSCVREDTTNASPRSFLRCPLSGQTFSSMVFMHVRMKVIGAGPSSAPAGYGVSTRKRDTWHNQPRKISKYIYLDDNLLELK